MLIQANIFQPLIDVFEAVLKFFHNSLGVPWGWSIVLLTVCVRLVLVPLMLRQFHSMQRMQAHMGDINAIREKYKDDKQRQNQEVMQFYRDNDISMFGSCLPLVLQLPVFLSLFYMLRKSLRDDICPAIQQHYRATFASHHPTASHATVVSQTTACGQHNGAEFLFIHDLTDKATGISLVILLVLYIGTQMASTLIMSAPTMDKNQRRMMMVLPMFFVLFVIRFPAGLMVYWITTNAWTMAQQWAFKQRLKRMQPAVAASPPTTGVGPTKPAASKSSKPAAKPASKDGAAPKGSGASGKESPPAGGLGAKLRNAAKPKTGAAAKTEAAAEAAVTPPPPPRKKKKRSGRRR